MSEEFEMFVLSQWLNFLSRLTGTASSEDADEWELRLTTTGGNNSTNAIGSAGSNDDLISGE